MCCGSGGVGKTTVSAALGVAIAAAEDKRVLVLTVDPARRLATALGIKGIGAQPVHVPKPRLKRAGMALKGDLEAAMLDMKQEWDRMIERYSPDRATAQRILRNPLYQRITDSFVGSHEYAAIEALYELHDAGEYDCIVVDTPPSRQRARLPRSADSSHRLRGITPPFAAVGLVVAIRLSSDELRRDAVSPPR